MKSNLKQASIRSMFGNPKPKPAVKTSPGSEAACGQAATAKEAPTPSRAPNEATPQAGLQAQPQNKQAPSKPAQKPVKSSKPAPTKSPAKAAKSSAPEAPPKSGQMLGEGKEQATQNATGSDCKSTEAVHVQKGQRLRVYWRDDKAWYTGTVTSLHGSKVQVTYDDGDVELLDLRREKFELIAQRLAKKKAKEAPTPDDGAHLEDSAALEDELSDAADSDDDFGDGSEAMDASDLEDDSDADSLCDEDSIGGSPVAPAKRKARQQAPAAGKRAKTAKEPQTASPTENAARNGGNGGWAAAATPACDADKKAARPPSAAAKTPAGEQSSRPSTGAGGAASAVPCRTPLPSSSARQPRGSLLSRLPDSAHGAAATPASAVTPGSLASQMVGDAARFIQRYSVPKFAFLAPNNLKDAKKRPPSHPDYDPSTLYIPPTWYKDHKVSDGQAQWWEFKAANFDSVLLFKMGKFYEMFEMDAFVGVEALGLQFMKGDQPHAGFPEAAYYTMAEQLVRAGHRVVVIEQTETPEQLKEYNDRAAKGQKRKVVQRTKVAVLTQGTLTEPLMLTASPDAAFAVGIVELQSTSQDAWVGLCAVDTAAARVMLCQFHDDALRSKMQRHLTELQASELVLPRNGELMPQATKALLKGMLPGARVTLQRCTDGAWDGAAVLQLLQKADLFQGDSEPPAALAARLADPGANAASLAAFAGMVAYLQDAMLEKAVLAVGTVSDLAVDDGSSQAPAAAEASGRPEIEDAPPGTRMHVDGSALQNLEVLENAEGSKLGTVFAALDHCVTPGGKRLLRHWLSHPLVSVADISARQDAVHALITTAADARDAASGFLSRMGDIERMVARLAGTAVGAFGREAPNVVLYEDPGRRRVKEMTGVLADMRALRDAVDAFAACLPALQAPVLADLVTWGQGMPDFRPALDDLLAAADWQAAEQAGQVAPVAGLDEAYDAATAALEQVDAELQQHLQDVRALVGRDVSYVSLNKDSHVLEVPEQLAGKVPRHYHAMAARKGFKRYSCDDLEALVLARKKAVEAVETAQGSILSSLVRRFADHRDMWLAACATCAQLDVLMSLAKASILGSDGGAMCRPTVTFTPPGASAPSSAPFFCAKALRHPTGIKLASAASFVPNDVKLGVDDAPFMLLTGPNMGGKSTLMRQVCVATLMAQVGAWLPADEVQLSPADAIFVRMGAKDHIMMGQSTFFVELSETASMLSRVTSRSLVALDELGRGTATMDGAAIAGAVLEHLLCKVGCRGVFATHYHSLSEEHAHDARVAIKHMACHVSDADGVSLPQVTFLYKLSPGACPKSYGANVAHIAGIPRQVAARASRISEALEQGSSAPPGGRSSADGAALGLTIPPCMPRVWQMLAVPDAQLDVQGLSEEARAVAASSD